MSYRVEIDTKALREIRALAKRASSLGSSPKSNRWPTTLARQGASNRLAAVDLWRIRSGDYRIIYQLRDDRLHVLVVRVGHCRDVYR